MNTKLSSGENLVFLEHASFFSYVKNLVRLEVSDCSGLAKDTHTPFAVRNLCCAFENVSSGISLEKRDSRVFSSTPFSSEPNPLYYTLESNLSRKCNKLHLASKIQYDSDT